MRHSESDSLLVHLSIYSNDRYQWIAASGLFVGLATPRTATDAISNMKARLDDFVDRRHWDKFVTNCQSANSLAGCDPSTLTRVHSESKWPVLHTPAASKANPSPQPVQVGPTVSTYLGTLGAESVTASGQTFSLPDPTLYNVKDVCTRGVSCSVLRSLIRLLVNDLVWQA